MSDSDNSYNIDHHLVQELQNSNYEAFERLYDKYAPLTLQRIKKLIPIQEEAEEIFQEIFLKIWQDREKLPLDVPFKAILFRKAKSLTYNFYRKAVLDKAMYEKILVSATTLYNELEEELSFKETNEFLTLAISKLPEQRQKIFKCVKIDGKTYEEVASEFGISLSTVKDHMSRALKFIRSELTNKYPMLLLLILTDTIFKS